MSVIGVILVVNIILKVAHLVSWSWLVVLWPLYQIKRSRALYKV